MINFLPEKLSKQVKAEYSTRVTSVFFIVFSLVTVFVLVFLAPAYTLAIYRKAVISNQLTMVKSSSVNQSNASLDQVKKVNEIVKVLSTGSAQKPASDFIKSILNIKTSSITISSMSSDFDNNQNTRISLKGFSNTRDNLTKFVKDIKNLNLFSSVDIPISSLVKSSDIDFVISIIVKKE